MAGKGNEPRVRCSFCGKTDEQVRKMIAGPDGAYICDECVGICSEIIEEEVLTEIEDSDTINLLKPKEIKAFLDEYVIGQDDAKKVLSVAVYKDFAGTDVGEAVECAVCDCGCYGFNGSGLCR